MRAAARAEGVPGGQFIDANDVRFLATVSVPHGATTRP